MPISGGLGSSEVVTQVETQNYIVTGEWTFPNNLPSSDLTPTQPNEFITKVYVDDKRRLAFMMM